MNPLDAAFDRLYLEYLPVRPSGVPDTTLGPTEQFKRLQARRGLWDMAAIQDEARLEDERRSA